MAAPLDLLVRRGARRHIRHLSPAQPGEAVPAPVARVYAQVERDFGVLAPPVALHAPAPETLAACWAVLRETLVVPGTLGRAAKEVVATAVSLGNACPYCVQVHGAVLHGLIGAGDALAVAAGHDGQVADPGHRALAAWARAAGTAEGAARHGRPFPREWFPELAGVVVAFEYLNRMVNVFLTEEPIPRALPAALRGGLTRLAGRALRPVVLRERAPGASLALLPAAPLPGDLSWAAPSPAIAGALARASAAIEEAGRRSVPGRVRGLVLAELAAWGGERRGLSRAWVREAVSGLPEAERPAGRFALLTAFASHQVDAAVIGELRRCGAGDRVLVETAAWASLAAARRVAGWTWRCG
ncbi:carboxymuconolactone decarboxylase family protein [Planomonospora sp. ID91781]|uniref:carboxymuconolactone decarboxylase family protein n=1 Tax=Planomonospora sp. ID91781 TaxID=2738135 RepID=UPI0018C354F5|nr:carboxymuconolactone decarboxylase family protein [Planomonospora sp. ID91781]MBG0823455.1 carboxymuconolactone decarboxylase family protein [Planomonospora sp. ID91781]